MVSAGSGKEPLVGEEGSCCGVWLGLCLDEMIAGMGKDMDRVECDRGSPLGPPMLITQKSKDEPRGPSFLSSALLEEPG